MPLYESLFSDCNDKLVKSSSDEEMSVDYPPLVSFSGFWNPENISSSSDTDHKVQSIYSQDRLQGLAAGAGTPNPNHRFDNSCKLYSCRL
ncbi:hypothetical protein NPIL_323601 [Nephila pilipes]|uniref:Uncharacterized protein n=1 Tax=Nephila pilipes TaxID=299642 RepID=A0A8X6QJ36_NEPPI|nr:hypothetical protein NPIL_323601 [Nephila pilipes]